MGSLSRVAHKRRLLRRNELPRRCWLPSRAVHSVGCCRTAHKHASHRVIHVSHAKKKSIRVGRSKMTWSATLASFRKQLCMQDTGFAVRSWSRIMTKGIHADASSENASESSRCLYFVESGLQVWPSGLAFRSGLQVWPPDLALRSGPQVWPSTLGFSRGHSVLSHTAAHSPTLCYCTGCGRVLAAEPRVRLRRLLFLPLEISPAAGRSG